MLTVHLVPLYLNRRSWQMCPLIAGSWRKPKKPERQGTASLSRLEASSPALVSGTLLFSDKCQDARAGEPCLPQAVVLRRHSGGKDLVLTPSTFPVLALISRRASFSSLPEDSTSTWQPLHKFFFILKQPGSASLLAPRSPPGACGKHVSPWLCFLP